MDCRTDESCNYKRRLAFNFHDVFNFKEQTFKAIKAIKDGFEGENIQNQYSVFRRSSQATELIFFSWLQRCNRS